MAERSYYVNLKLANNQVIKLRSVGNTPKEAVGILLRANGGGGNLSDMDIEKISEDKCDIRKLGRNDCYALVVGVEGRKVENYYYCNTRCNLLEPGNWTSIT